MTLCLLIMSGCQSEEVSNDMKNATLLQAAEQGNVEQITKLLEDGANINTVDGRGRTAAMIAVHTNQLELFELLIEKGADINIRDQRSDNPLLYAGAEGLLDFVKVAVAAGADTTITNRFGGTALIPAADRGHVEVVEELLKTSDVDIDHINNLGWTALLEAVLLGDGGERHQQIIQLLVDYGADVNLADGEGITPLQHAKRLNYGAIVHILEHAGAH
ncbi:ankyrin repeat domain-containing protein [Paenibacillus yanchengensis]|uniref:Ankyrin repeat domain-containing protein n=1 Tax=Paenibacillus yanchengensis TaxID=2035833 RepID=A0ABW4YHG6_9BACL